MKTPPALLLPTPRHRASGPVALALLHIELAGLAELRSSHGQRAAGELLDLVEARLTRGSRHGDRIRRQAGGEQFHCLLGELHSGAQAKGIAERLLQRLGAPWLLGNERISLRPRIGIAFGRDESADLAGLHRVAEAALLAAHRQPGGPVQLGAAETST